MHRLASYCARGHRCFDSAPIDQRTFQSQRQLRLAYEWVFRVIVGLVLPIPIQHTK